MRFGLQLLFVLCLAIGFQSGIVGSAAAGLKLPCLESLSIEGVDRADKDGVSPETPSPSCKSMTTASEASFDPPRHDAGISQKMASTGSRGLWRTLQIDEPPKPALML